MKNKDFIPRLIQEVKLTWTLPTSFRKGFDLLEQGAVLVLLRVLTQRQAEAAVASVKAAYEDWNEVRVSQAQEIAAHIEKPGGKQGDEKLLEVAGLLKSYLQDVFQETHGLELEFLREDVALGAKLMSQMTVLGLAGGAYLLWHASGEQVPVHITMIRFLDRLGLIGRTSSVAKATSAIDPLVPAGQGLEFTLAVHEAMERWNDPERPIYEDVAVLRECAYGKKAFQERRSLIARQEAQRKRDEARRKQQAKKEEELRRKDEERNRKKAEALAKKQEREAEKRRKLSERRAQHEAKKQAAQKAAKKKAADKAKADAAAKKKAAKKKSTASKKKPTAKKKTTKKKAAAKKPATRKKVTAKKATAKKATARKKTSATKKASKPAARKTKSRTRRR